MMLYETYLTIKKEFPWDKKYLIDQTGIAWRLLQKYKYNIQGFNCKFNEGNVTIC